MTRPFHLAFPVTSLSETRQFYIETLGCTPGRSSDRWLDFNFFDHQLSAHLVDSMPSIPHNEVDGKQIPVMHFGIVLKPAHWEELKKRLYTLNVPFLIEPYIRFQGQVGEQGTFFILDPSGNGLEFKMSADDTLIFST